MDDQNINALNDLLKGEQMAINAYSKFINDVRNEKIRERLKSIQSEHNDHQGIISDRILEMGGKPVQSTGFAGFMADAKYGFESMKERTDHEILLEAFQGEDKGVAAAEKIADDKLDDKSLKVVHKIMEADHGHIKELEKLLHETRIQ
jgi:rubrerythrin